MSVVLTAIVSGKTAPGATTSTWALTLAWPRAVVAVDADPAGGDMVPGLLAGRTTVDHGLLSWTTTTRRMTAPDSAAIIGDHIVALPEAPHAWLMPGLQNPSQATAIDSRGWQRLAAALEDVSAGRRDVLIDTGRLSESSCWSVIRACDRILLVSRRSVRSIHATRNAATTLQSRLGDLNRVQLLVVGNGPYAADAIAAQLGIRVAAEFPEARDAAAVLSDGATASLRGLRRSRLLRSARALASALLAPAAEPATRSADLAGPATTGVPR